MVDRRGNLRLAQQAFAIRHYFRESRPALVRGRLTWRWSVRPSELSRTYGIVLSAREYAEPRVFVVMPDLEPDAKGRLPHVYDNGALCLNRQGEWQPTMLFTDTYIPWASQWLFFYEVWKATGIWHGDGIDAINPDAQAALLHPYEGPQGVDSC